MGDQPWIVRAARTLALTLACFASPLRRALSIGGCGWGTPQAQRQSCHHSSRDLHDTSGQAWPARWVEGRPECSYLPKSPVWEVTVPSFPASALSVTVPSEYPAEGRGHPISLYLLSRPFLGDGHSSSACPSLLSRSRFTGKYGPSPNVAQCHISCLESSSRHQAASVGR